MKSAAADVMLVSFPETRATHRSDAIVVQTVLRSKVEVFALLDILEKLIGGLPEERSSDH
jgi:hypothetical protein